MDNSSFICAGSIDSHFKATAGKFPVSHPPPSYSLPQFPPKYTHTNSIENFSLIFDHNFEKKTKHKAKSVLLSTETPSGKILF